MTGKTSDLGSAEQQEKQAQTSLNGGALTDLRDKLKHTKLYDLKVKASHLRHRLGKFENLINTNHRHDEEHEQITDAKRTKIAEGHRFQSFAPETVGNRIKWYIDGRDYFHAVSIALEQAKETIYIMDWWLSPELFLRRPPYFNQEWRLDYTLKRAAERGVKIYVMVYREVEAALTCNSQHTKRALMSLCPEGSPGYGNIVVMRHPDHNVFENASDMTFYWAHHEKAMVIDYNIAFIGGLDLCFGRWDSRQHPLSDAHPSSIQNEVWPGQDWNNNRISDFQNVKDWKNNEVSKVDFARMPWHDVAMCVVGPAIYSIAEHFCLRWNFIKRDKYKRDDRYDWLTLTGRTGENEDLVGVQRPKHPVGEYVHHPLSSLDGKYGNPRKGTTQQHPSSDDHTEHETKEELDTFAESQHSVDEHGYTHDQHQRGHGIQKRLNEHGIHRPHLHPESGDKSVSREDIGEPTRQENAKMTGNNAKKEGFVTASGGMQEKSQAYHSDHIGSEPEFGPGTIRAQLVRSSADWSSGILTEQSIQNAYCQIIRAAKHYVYIENQFFICATGEKQAPIHNQIGAAIVDACVAAAKEDRKFRVIIMIPCIPGFAGDLRSDAATGTRAIMSYQYQSICRGEESIFGKIKAAGYDPTKYVFCFNLRSYDRINKTPTLKEQEEKAGVTYQEVQRAHAEEIMPEGVHASENVESAHESKSAGFLEKLGQLGKKKGNADQDVPDEAAADMADKKRRFQDQGAGNDDGGEGKDAVLHTEDSIAKNAMLTDKIPSQENWAGRTEEGHHKGDTEEDQELRQQETENFVQEELYIHAKVLIVDDKITICGSSNINDRSQLGFHDSELSIVMEDTRGLESKMDGQPFTAGYHAATLRRMLWREHLGLLPPQPLRAEDDPNAQLPDVDNNWFEGDEYDKLVEDPLSEELWDMWTTRATTNTLVFRNLFHADPDDNVKTFEDYDRFLGPLGSRKTGHLFDPFQPVAIVRQNLDRIKGHLVWMPLRFLEKAEMAESGLQVNQWTESIYC